MTKDKSKRQTPKELSEVIDDTIARFLATSEPTCKMVSDAVIEENEQAIQELGISLAQRCVRQWVAHRMKKVVEINRQTGEQFRLPFDIVGVPSAITFLSSDLGEDVESEDDGGKEAVHYIALSRATEQHLIAYEDLLASQISADRKQLQAIKKLRAHFRNIFSSHPGITIGKASEIYRRQVA